MNDFARKHDAHLAGQYDAPPLPEEPERPSWFDVTAKLIDARSEIVATHHDIAYRINNPTAQRMCDALERLAEPIEPDEFTQGEIATIAEELDRHAKTLRATDGMRRGSQRERTLRHAAALLNEALELLEDVQ